MKKNTGILILGIIIFFVLQTLIIGVFYLKADVGFSNEYRRGLEHNFAKIVEIVENNKDDISKLNLTSVYTYNFKNIVLVKNDSSISFVAIQTDNYFVGSRFEVSGFNFANLFSPGIYIKEATVYGVKSILFSKSVGDYAVVAYEDLIIEEQYLSALTTSLIIVAVLQLVLLAGFIVIYMVLFKQKGDEFSSYSASNPRYFVFFIDNSGKIIENKSSQFVEKYDTINILDYVIDTDVTIAKAINERLPFNLFLTDKDNNQNYYHCLATKAQQGYKILAINNTKQYFENKKISEQIFLDNLTGLRNKSALELDLEECLRQETKEQRAVAIFNIRNLDTLDTLFSNAVKEEMIKKCAAMFKEKYKGVTGVYYFDDNRFAILCSTTATTEETKQSINEFNNNLNAIMRINSHNVQVITDVIFLYLDNTSSDVKLDEIIEYNEYLILNIKTRVNSNVVSEKFTKSKYFHAIGSKKEITKKIISDNNFRLFFQPQYRLSDKKLVAFEALVRLNEVSMTTQDFILISEVNGYMLQLGELIMKRAFEFAKLIKKTGILISINLSPIQLLNKGFVDNFLKSYHSYGLNDNSISLEITETFLMTDIAENIKKLQIFHDNKICIQLDDFGMGYSSLAYLKNFPVNTIKIDREFVDGIDTNEYSRAISKFIISTAKQLNMETIAEGVETQAQADCLKKIGCDIIQGYLTGKAMSVEDALLLIERKEDAKV